MSGDETAQRAAGPGSPGARAPSSSTPATTARTAASTGSGAGSSSRAGSRAGSSSTATMTSTGGAAGGSGPHSSVIAADTLDYFSEKAAKLGTGGSTGVMIQSPDGRPAGIFFHPRTNTSSSLSSTGSIHTPAASSPLSPAHASAAATAANNSAAIGSTAATSAFQALRRGSSGDDLLSPALSGRASMPGGVQSPPVPSPRSNNQSPLGGEAMAGINTANGNIFTPQVGLDSIMSDAHPPTVTPLHPIKGDDGGAASTMSVPLTELSDASSTLNNYATGTPSQPTASQDKKNLTGTLRLPTVKGDRAEKDDAQPRSPDEYGDAPNTFSFASASQNLSAKARQNRKSFGAHEGNGLAMTRQTFGSAHPSNAAARPSAQPQSGLLIGAGFSQPRRKGKTGPQKATASIEVLPPIKVLIVEDNPINVKILSTFLKQRKIKFGVARDGREAVNEWQTGGYHLILMDIQLPVMDGIEATKEIRRLEQEANIGPLPAKTPGVAPVDLSTKELGGPNDLAPNKPSADVTGATSPSIMLQNSLRASVIIVALTASVLNSDRVAALAAGCNDFLNKPVDLRWLERKVIEWGSMQYLISFREWPPDLSTNRLGARKGGAGGASRKTYLSPTYTESLRSEGLIDRGFGMGPDQNAREVAGKLYIGGKKGKTEGHLNVSTATASS